MTKDEFWKTTEAQEYRVVQYHRYLNGLGHRGESVVTSGVIEGSRYAPDSEFFLVTMAEGLRGLYIQFDQVEAVV